jgi:hypothetical protein
MPPAACRSSFDLQIIVFIDGRTTALTLKSGVLCDLTTGGSFMLYPGRRGGHLKQPTAWTRKPF